jgi:hypothetical protein
VVALNEVLLVECDNSILLRFFARVVERKLIRNDKPFEEVEPLSDKFFTVMHQKHTKIVKLDIIEFMSERT